MSIESPKVEGSLKTCFADVQIKGLVREENDIKPSLIQYSLRSSGARCSTVHGKMSVNVCNLSQAKKALLL